MPRLVPVGVGGRASIGDPVTGVSGTSRGSVGGLPKQRWIPAHAGGPTVTATAALPSIPDIGTVSSG